MLINETSKATNLTKKAIEYYTEQKLISPVVLENGYRNFSKSDIERLKKISIFRKLGLSTQEVKAVLADETGDALQKVSVQKELHAQREHAKKTLLDKLSCGKSLFEIDEGLIAIEQSSTVTEKLLEAFPGYYGRFICLHFARFLNEPITTQEQLCAYREIVSFLDNAPMSDLPEDLRTFLAENAKHFSTENICQIVESTKQSIENPEKFLSENKEILEQYLEFKQSDEYKSSLACKMQALLKEFNNASGYYDIFIPAMKKLSKVYAEYIRQMDIANEKLLMQYPEVERLNN